MHGLSMLASWSAYVTFCAALLFGAHAWLEAQSARVDAALNASSRMWSCAVVQDLGRSGDVVLLGRVYVCQDSWRPEVVRAVS